MASDIFVTEEEFRSLCNAGTLAIQEIYLHAMRTFPDVQFTLIDSRKDFVQMAFYDAMAYSYGVPQEAPIEAYAFQAKLQEFEAYYRDRATNFKDFEVDSEMHMYTN